MPREGSRPAWAPGDVDLFTVPEPVRRAVAEIVEPAYRKLVAEVEDPLERSIGLTLVQRTSGQLTGISCQWRARAEGGRGKPENCHPKTSVQMTGISGQ